MGFLAKNIEQEIDILARRIRVVAGNAKKESKSVFRKAAKPLVQEIQARAPVYTGTSHARYLNGIEVARYYRGNLKRSIRVLSLRKANSIYVGPKVGGRDSKGVFKGNRVDAYYAHLMEFEYGLGGKRPQPFLRPGAQAAGPTVLRMAQKEFKNIIETGWAKRYSQVRGR